MGFFSNLNFPYHGQVYFVDKQPTLDYVTFISSNMNGHKVGIYEAFAHKAGVHGAGKGECKIAARAVEAKAVHLN